MFSYKQAIRICFILFGNILYAVAVVFFILPNHLMTGGTTGLALFFNRLWQIPVSAFVGIFNILMFALGAYVLGKTFAFTTILSTFFYPFVLQLLESVFGSVVLTKDPMLATIFAGLLIGAAIGIVVRAGASTGGMDIPPLVLHKKWGISVSISMYAFDVLILLSQMFFSDKEHILYGLLLVLIYTIVLDKVLMIGKGQVQVKIISEAYEKINLEIQQKLDRGTTLFKTQGGFSQKENNTILTVVSGRELPKLNDLVMEIDPDAFLIINRVNEVKGRGFTTGKKYADLQKKV